MQLCPLPAGTQVAGGIALRLPPVGPSTTLKVSAGAAVSTSVALSVMTLAVSSGVVIPGLSAATGGSFTAVTVMVTVAGTLSDVPSLTLNVKLSGPL